jgi:hypothetical protein
MWKAVSGLTVIIALSSGCSAPERTQPSAAVAEALAQRVVHLMEDNFAEEIAPHHAGSLACAVHVFGVDPSTAASANDVSIAYAWVYCEERLRGPLLGDQVSVPVAIHLTATPSIDMPSDGEEYSSSVAKIFPSDLRSTATYPPPYVEDLVQEVAATRPSPSPQHN